MLLLLVATTNAGFPATTVEANTTIIDPLNSIKPVVISFVKISSQFEIIFTTYFRHSNLQLASN